LKEIAKTAKDTLYRDIRADSRSSKKPHRNRGKYVIQLTLSDADGSSGRVKDK